MTPPQWRELRRIALGGDGRIPGAGWFGTRPEIALKDKGLIEYFAHESTLGGRGAISHARVIWHCCRLTAKGRRLLKRETARGLPDR